MKSMTGFGYAEQVSEELSISVEMKTYNNRYLDLNINLPVSISPLEDRVRKFLTEKVSRGRVDLYVKLKEFAGSAEIIVDEEAVKKQHAALVKIANIAGLDETIHLAHLLRVEGLVKSISVFDPERYWTILHPVLHECTEKLDLSRIAEGKTIEVDIVSLLDQIEEEGKTIAKHIPLYSEKIKTQVRDKFLEVLGNQVDENRVLLEIASLLIKYDINEELSRLSAHVASFRKSITGEALVGRKLDFLCQELNREVNTMGSKSIIVEINNAVVNCKEIIERIREQLRNVE
ncbi:MAG: YicC family protein [Spirochaetaceae bacterium]|nr:MAG: YicC family protein [Spirochaetaceae bacterium]